jgi:hypothetical protein
MQTGFGAVQDAIDEAKSRSNSTGRGLFPVGWKDGEKKIVRFLTDDVITCEFYEFIKKYGQDGATDFICAPSLFPDDPEAKDWVLQYGGQSLFAKTSDEKPSKRKMTIGMVAIREEVKGEDGSMEVQDVLEEFEMEEEVDGKTVKTTYPARKFEIIKQAHGNFWETVIAYYLRYGKTICDRDYEITRKGSDKNTSYTIIPVQGEKDKALPSAEAVQEHFGYGKKREDNDPDRFLYATTTLKQWASDYASEGRAKYWLTANDDEKGTDSKKSESSSSNSDSKESEARVDSSSETRMSNLRDRVKAHKSE